MCMYTFCIKRFYWYFILIFLLFLCPKYGYSINYASDTWAMLKKYIAVHPGTDESVWENWAFVTDGLMEMTPKGDGTYEAIIGLEKGQTYNFIFFAKTDASPPPGLQANYTYYDCVPTGGNIQNGTAPYQVIYYDSTQQSPVHYDHIGLNWDARRVITVPDYLNPGDSFYVYGNFSDKPGAVTDLKATPMDTTTVRLTWSYPYGYWGSWGENVKAVDVIAGGTYVIYRSTYGDSSNFIQIAELPGNVFGYTDTGLDSYVTYYYVIVCKDAYTGQYDTEPFKQLSSDTTDPDSATPRPPIQIRFRVDGLDWDYVSHHRYIVYLTDVHDKNRFFAKRIRGTIARVYLK